MNSRRSRWLIKPTEKLTLGNTVCRARRTISFSTPRHGDSYFPTTDGDGQPEFRGIGASTRQYHREQGIAESPGRWDRRKSSIQLGRVESGRRTPYLFQVGKNLLDLLGVVVSYLDTDSSVLFGGRRIVTEFLVV